MHCAVRRFYRGIAYHHAQFGAPPEYTGETHHLPAGKRALIVTTSHGVLNAPGETTGEATGIAISELTHPYYSYLDAGMKVDVASIKGDQVPVDPGGLRRTQSRPKTSVTQMTQH